MVAVVLQARMGSKRFPGKVMADLNGRPMLEWIMDRLERARSPRYFILATTVEPSDDVLSKLAESRGWRVYRGPVDDVLKRFAKAVENVSCEIVVRATADNPLVDPDILDLMVEVHKKRRPDVINYEGLPIGIPVVVASKKTLLALNAQIQDAYYREHVLLYPFEHPERFRIVTLKEKFSNPAFSQVRLTVDYPEDLERIKKIWKYFPHGNASLDDLFQLFEKNPDVFL